MSEVEVIKSPIVLRTPIKSPLRLKTEEVSLYLQALRLSLKMHEGSTAILFVKEGKNMVPYVVKIERFSPFTDILVGRYYVAVEEGKNTVAQHHMLSAEKLMTGEQRLLYLTEGG